MCPKLGGCPFFNDRMAEKPAMAAMLKKAFCQGDHPTCARFRCASAGVAVPVDLFPNQAQRLPALGVA